MNICFIGWGNLAQALARGLLQEGVGHLSATAPSLPQGQQSDGVQTDSDNSAFLSKADVVILAVKPNIIATVLSEIAQKIPTDCLLISVAAGVPLSFMAQRCKPQQALLRSMPNTPAAIGQAATPLCANNTITALQKERSEQIFNSLGIISWVSEERTLDSLTALSGSGPAYVLLFMEAMIKAAQALGIERPLAEAFTRQTLQGTIQWAQSRDTPLSELRQAITSPGGTTQAALAILAPQMDSLMHEAMLAAQNRSIELGQNLCQDSKP